MNILRRELRAGLKSLLIWSGIAALYAVIELGEFAVYYNNPEYSRVLEMVPPAVIAALSMDAFNLTTISGFFGVLSGYLVLAAALAAAMWGADSIAREERDRTAEFALTLPVTRLRLVLGKAGASGVMCALMLGALWAAVLLSARRYAPDAAFYRYVAIVMLSFALIQAVFLGLGLLLGCVLGGRRAGPTAVSILLATYFAGFLMELNQDLVWLRYLTPFKYFDPLLMLQESRLEPRFVTLALAVATTCLTLGCAAYQRRDLHV